jgi:hypothetical protein
MWEKATTWAVKKIGGVRAKSVHATEQEGVDALEAAGKGYALEVRNGERTRCATFCSVNYKCSQWNEYNRNKEIQ